MDGQDRVCKGVGKEREGMEKERGVDDTEMMILDDKCFTQVSKTTMYLPSAKSNDTEAMFSGFDRTPEKTWQRLRKATGYPQLTMKLAPFKASSLSARILVTMVTQDNKHRF